MGFLKEVFKQAAVNIVANAVTGNRRREPEKKTDQSGCTGCLLIILGFLLLPALAQNPQIFLAILSIAGIVGIVILFGYVIAELVTKFQNYLAERREDREYARQMAARKREQDIQEQAEHERFLEHEKWHGIPEIRKAYYALKNTLEDKKLVKELQVAESVVNELVKAKYMAFDHLDAKSSDKKELEVLKAEITRLGKQDDPEYFLPLQRLEEKIAQHDLVMRNFRETSEKVDAFLIKLRLQAVSGETTEDNESFVELKRVTEALEQGIKTLDKI